MRKTTRLIISSYNHFVSLHRFLQGPETDQATVSKINNAIEEQREITLQIINYTKSGK